VSALVLAVYFAGPFLLLRTHRVWGVPAAILALWIPIEVGFFRWAGIPSGWAIATGIAAGVCAFRNRRDIMDVSAAFDFRRLDFREAFMNFILIAAIAIPTGLAIGFIQPSLDLPGLGTTLLSLATIILFNALPEEILFRGIIQHSIESRLKNRVFALLIASLIFGAAHLNNGAMPNYKYFALASIAGVFYGRAWRGQRNVLTSTVTHTLVNFGWRLFFR